METGGRRLADHLDCPPREADAPMALPTPPALSGLPLLGNLLEYRRDHVEVFWRGYRTLGPIFSVRLGPQRAAVLIGPEYHEHFFSQADQTLSLPEVYRFVVPMFGPVLNAADDQEVRRSQLRLLHSAFHGRKMQQHVEVMAHEIEAWLDGLGEYGSFEAYETFSHLGMNIAASALMGPEVRGRMAEFRPLYRALAEGMEFVLPPNLPLPRFRRRDRARVALHALIRPVIAERRAHPELYDDFLQTIVNGEYGVDGPAADETVVGLALMTVFTAYITTAAQTSWSLVQLLQHPAYLGSMLEEQQAVLGDGADPPVQEQLGRLERLEWALKESQRLHPAMSHYARYTAQAYELGGYQIPRGWFTMVCPSVSHRLPELFSDPDVYDPKRFGPGRAEDRGHPYSLIGFGGGVYRCPGQGFGINEMKLIISLLLRRYDLMLHYPNPGRSFDLGIVRPNPPCVITYRRRDSVGSERRPRGEGAPASLPQLITACPVTAG